MDPPYQFASPPTKPEAPPSVFHSQPRPLPDPSAFVSQKLEKRRRSDMSDADSKTKAAVLECPEKPTKSPPLSRIFITRPAHHTAHARFLWVDPEMFPERPATQHADHSDYFEKNFDVLEKLGGGGGDSVAVYKAVFRLDRKVYAVKKSREFHSKTSRNLMTQEVRNVMAIKRHKHCLQYVQAWEQQGHVYLLMEFCPATLHDIIRSNVQISDDMLWSWLHQITLGLKHIHDQGLLHLDIKPSNLFLQENVVKIGDFGRAHFFHANTAVEEGMEGDRRYMAQELLQNRPESPSADVFSLGMTMFELSSEAELPDNGELWQELRAGMIPSDDVYDKRPLELRNLIRRMLAPNPTDRPTCIDILNNSSLIAAVHRLGGAEPMVCPETPSKSACSPNRENSIEDVVTTSFDESPMDADEPRLLPPPTLGIRPKNLLFEFDKVAQS